MITASPGLQSAVCSHSLWGNVQIFTFSKSFIWYSKLYLWWITLWYKFHDPKLLILCQSIRCHLSVHPVLHIRCDSKCANNKRHRSELWALWHSRSERERATAVPSHTGFTPRKLSWWRSRVVHFSNISTWAERDWSSRCEGSFRPLADSLLWWEHCLRSSASLALSWPAWTIRAVLLKYWLAL